MHACAQVYMYICIYTCMPADGLIYVAKNMCLHVHSCLYLSTSVHMLLYVSGCAPHHLCPWVWEQ